VKTLLLRALNCTPARRNEKCVDGSCSFEEFKSVFKILHELIVDNFTNEYAGSVRLVWRRLMAGNSGACSLYLSPV
jgi:hypothetical protein